MRVENTKETNAAEEHPWENEVPSWLRNLQENSWELELLISGGAVFTLIQLPSFFYSWITSVRIHTSLPGFSIYLVLGVFGIKILTNGFILHLILRAYWLAMVCLNFVYPSGISQKAAKLTYPFRNRHKEGDLRDLIMRVDKVCGLVIFSSISSAILLLANLLLLGFLILIISSMETILSGLAFEPLNYLVLALVWLMVLYIADLLSFGFFRKLKYVAVMIYPVFFLYDAITFRRFYERPLVFFGSNVKKGSFYLGAGIFAAVTVLTVYGTVFRTMNWRNPFDFREYRFTMAPEESELGFRYYADEADWPDRQIVFIPSKIIENNFLMVNVTYVKGMDPIIFASAKSDSLRFMSNILELSIDDSVYKNVQWYSRWEKETDHIGVSAAIPIGNLPNGPHLLQVGSPDLPDEKYRKLVKESGRTFQIPFWKDVY